LNLTSKTVLLHRDTLKPKISDVAMLGIKGGATDEDNNNAYNANTISRFGHILHEIILRISLAEYNTNFIRIMKLQAIHDKSIVENLVARPDIATIVETLDTL